MAHADFRGIPRAAMRILFVSSNRVGDAVLSTGLLDYLIRSHLDARITVACGPVAEGVFARMPNREQTFLLRKQPWDLHWLPFWARMVTRVWDLVVDIRGSGLAYLLPARRRAVLRRRGGHKLVELASILQLSDPPLPVTWTAPQDRERARSLLSSPRPIIALGPTANWQPKTWPAEHFAALFKALSAGPLPGALPAVFAGPGCKERTLAAPLLTLLPQAIDLVGRLSLPEAAACLARAALYVGNDSGLMHLAAAAGVPTLGLFGPTAAEQYAPVGRRTAFVRAPTGRMEDLSVEQVLAATWQLLV
jgi:heptosyltransferase III